MSDQLPQYAKKMSRQSWLQFSAAFLLAVAAFLFALFSHINTNRQLDTIKSTQGSIEDIQGRILQGQSQLQSTQGSIEGIQGEILEGQGQLHRAQESIKGEQATIKNSLDELDLAFRELNTNIDQLGKLSTTIVGDIGALQDTVIGAGAPVEPKLPLAEDPQTPTPDPSDPDDSGTSDSIPARVDLSIGIAAHDHWACPAGEDCRWMQVSHSGLGEGPWEVKCATRGLSRSQSNNVDPDNHEVWRVYETTFNPTNGCLYWHEGNTVYVIMDNMRSNELLWNP